MRNQEIKKNKGKSLGKGKRFPVEVTEEVTVADSMSLAKSKEYVNLREYRKICKRRWNMSKKEAETRWQELLQDESVPKATDQMNWTTMPVIMAFQWLN